MILRSNISQVVGRLKRLEAGLPEAAARAIAPQHWKGRLEHIALKTLRAQWALERNLATRTLYERMTPRIVSTLMAEVFSPNGSRFTLSIPAQAPGGNLNVQAVVDYATDQRTETGRRKKLAIATPEGEASVEQARRAIRDFVWLEKEQDARDAGRSNEEIAQRLEEILGLSDRPRPRTPEMNAAAEGLTAAIQRWLDGDGRSPAPAYGGAASPAARLSPETVAHWLQAVLLAWREYMRLHLGDRLCLEIRNLHQRVRTELL